MRERPNRNIRCRHCLMSSLMTSRFSRDSNNNKIFCFLFLVLPNLLRSNILHPQHDWQFSHCIYPVRHSAKSSEIQGGSIRGLLRSERRSAREIEMEESAEVKGRENVRETGKERAGERGEARERKREREREKEREEREGEIKKQ